MRAELERQTPLESDRPRANEAVVDLGVLGRFGMASWEGAQSRQSIGINSDGLRCTLYFAATAVWTTAATSATTSPR